MSVTDGYGGYGGYGPWDWLVPAAQGDWPAAVQMAGGLADEQLLPVRVLQLAAELGMDVTGHQPEAIAGAVAHALAAGQQIPSGEAVMWGRVNLRGAAFLAAADKIRPAQILLGELGLAPHPDQMRDAAVAVLTHHGYLAPDLDFGAVLQSLAHLMRQHSEAELYWFQALTAPEETGHGVPEDAALAAAPQDMFPGLAGPD
ncbi:hypothetical protein JHN49_41050, partial [Streptomyces sp. MBT57]|nr:hypothetical protein [Streptomyces sp. MBT57]